MSILDCNATDTLNLSSRVLGFRIPEDGVSSGSSVPDAHSITDWATTLTSVDCQSVSQCVMLCASSRVPQVRTLPCSFLSFLLAGVPVGSSAGMKVDRTSAVVALRTLGLGVSTLLMFTSSRVRWGVFIIACMNPAANCNEMK